MILYYAGMRYSFLKGMKLPELLMFSFDDVGPFGGGEQKKLFRECQKARSNSIINQKKATHESPERNLPARP